MLRTNSKKARENVRAYIMEHGADFAWSIEGINDPSFDELATVIINDFERCTEGDRRHLTRQEFFEDYAQGLPCDGLFLYYYTTRNAIDDLGAILEETETEKARYTEEQAAKYLTYLIYSELSKAVNH